MTAPPREPKLYHIVHIDRLASIRGDGALWSDAQAEVRGLTGTTIGMSTIKQRRRQSALSSHDGLRVGDCVPFYFCPRSVMLYLLYRTNHRELEYRGGQEPIIHLEAELRRTVSWAEKRGRHWAFTTSNAGSLYFEDYADLAQLDQIDWTAVRARQWAGAKQEGKQAEFLVEGYFAWELVERIGVVSDGIREQVLDLMRPFGDIVPYVEVQPEWYY